MGNRQQSRFLALISSYDRYSELSEKAANAAGAGEEQFEKTLEGIEAKTQQLQTSLQNLYTSAGVQDLYSVLLGIGANILNFYNNISNAFGSGIRGALTAIGEFGAQFYNIAKIVITVLRMIKAHYVATGKEITAVQSLENKLRTNQDLSEEDQKLLEKYKQNEKYQKRLTALEAQYEKVRTARDIQNENTKLSLKARMGNFIKSNGGQIAYTAGTVGSMIGTMVGGQVGNGITFGSGLIGAAGAFANRDPIGMLMSLVTAIPALISFIDGATETAEERLERLTKEADEASSKAKAAQSEQKNLQSTIQTLQELEVRRYESEESAKEYQTFVNSLSDSYSNLILGYDEAGNAVLRMIDLEAELTKVRERTADATYNAALAEYNKRLEQYKQLEAEFGTIFLGNIEGGAAVARLMFDRELEDTPEDPTDPFYENDKMFYYEIMGMKKGGIARIMQDPDFYPTLLKEINEAEQNDQESRVDVLNRIKEKYLEINQDFNQTLDILESSIDTLNYQYILKKYSSYGFSEDSGPMKLFSNQISNDFKNSSETNWTKFISNSNYDYLAEDFKNFWEKLSNEDRELFNQMLDSSFFTFEDVFNHFELPDNSNITAALKNYYEQSSIDRNKRLVNRIGQIEEDPRYQDSNLTGLDVLEKIITETDISISANEERLINKALEFYLKLKEISDNKSAEYLRNFDDLLIEINKQDPILAGDILQLIEKNTLTSVEGIQVIIDTLISNYGMDMESPLIKYLINIQESIVENIALSIQAATDNFSKQWQKDSKDLESLSSGVDFSKVSGIIAEAKNLGVNLSYKDFIQNGEKFILTSEAYGKYVEAYFENQKKVTKRWEPVVNKLAELISSNPDEIDYDLLLKDTDFLYQIGFKDYAEYLTEAGTLTEEGQEELKKRILSAQEDIDTYNWIIDQANNQLAEELVLDGQIDSALRLLGATDIESLLSEFKVGDFSNAPKNLIPALLKYYNSINDNIYKAFTDSLSEGTTQVVNNLTGEQVKFLEGKAGVTMLNESTALFDAAKLSNEELQQWYSIILSDELKLTDKNKTAFLNAIDSKISDKSLVNVLNEIADSYDGFGVETAQKLAEAMKMSLEEAQNSKIIKFDEKSRKYSISYDTLITQLNTIDVTADPESYAELQNTINELIKSVADSITEALSGELDVKDAEVLKRRAKDILGIDINFEQTTKGLKISTDQALELLSKLREVDAVSAAIVETALAESFKEANGECKNLFETQKNILKLEDQIAAAGSTATKAAKERLNIYKQISREQMMQSSSYSFMSNVYDPLKGPGTYLQDIITMRDTIKQAEEDGYVDMDKAFAMVEQAYTWAQLSDKSYNILGMTISKDAESLQKAFTAMGQSWVEVDGGLGFDIASIGANFNSDLTEASSDIDSGMRVFAESQVEMLDGLIAFLEGIVALEELTTSTESGLKGAFDALVGDDGVLKFTDIYDKANKKLTTAGQGMVDAIKELTEEQKNVINQAYKINVNGDEMGLVDWLDSLDPIALKNDAQKISSMLFAVFSTIGKDWDLTALNENISNALSDTGMTFSYGENGGILFDFLGNEKPVERNVTIHLNIEGMEMADLQQLENVFEHLDLVDENGEVLSGKIGGAEYQLTMGVDGKLHLTIGGVEYGEPLDLANTGTSVQDWFSNTINNYIEKNKLKLTADDFTAISASLTDDNISPITGGGSVHFEIAYSDDAGTAGTVRLGTITEQFGPDNKSYKTAGAAMQAVAEEYNNTYGSGTLSDIPLSTKFITITSTSGVKYSFKVDPGKVNDLGDLVAAFQAEAVNITSIISSVENEAQKDKITLGEVILEPNDSGDYNVKLSAAYINGTKSLTYSFTVTPPSSEDNQTLHNQIDAKIGAAMNALSALIGAANKMPQIINGVELRDNEDGTYTLELGTITINGEKTIKYGGITIKSDTGGLTEEQITNASKEISAAKNSLPNGEEFVLEDEWLLKPQVDVTLELGDVDTSKIEEGVNEAIEEMATETETSTQTKVEPSENTGKSPKTDTTNDKTPETIAEELLNITARRLEGVEIGKIQQHIDDLPSFKALGEFMLALTNPENLEGIYSILQEDWDNLDDFKANLQATFGEETINSLGENFMPFLYSWYRELVEMFNDGSGESDVKSWIDGIDKKVSADAKTSYLRQILAMAVKWQMEQSESQDNIDDKSKTTSDEQDQTRTVQKIPDRPQRQITGDKFDDLNAYLSGMSQYFDQMAAYGYWRPGKNAKQANDEANANEETVAELQETNAQLEATTAVSEEISSLMNTDPVTWTSLASTELKATVHGDLWGGGNQVVLPDGNGGNLHFNLADYIKAFNAAYSGVQETAEESPVEIPITENGTDAIWEKVRSVVSQINDQKATIKIQAEVNSVNVAVTDENGNPVPTTSGAGKAKGDTAFAKGTLMGELGPELYVTGGHYYVAGQSGAEFVDLPDDAIVFNHLQTQRLLGNGKAGRGKAVTNEKKATSYATGNMAMASASETLSRLKAIRDLWQGILDRGIKELSTAGGGGGGGGKEDDTGFLHELDRWYNLMRQIEKCEQQITYQQKLRENMRKGDDYIKSLEYELALLEKEQSNYRTLANAQREYYLAQMKWLNEESIWGTFFTYDEDGLMQYRSPEIKVLFEAESRNAYGNSKYTSEQQYNLIRNELLAHGFSADIISQYLDYDETGKKLDKVSDKLQNFYDRFDGTIENQDSLYDSYHDYVIKDEETQAKQNEILEEYQELQLNLEQQLLKAIEDREQAIIDKLQDNYDALKDASDKYTNGLSDALNKEKQLYEQDKSDSELAKLQRQLAILQRSGGSASSIRSLQDQINSQMRDRYFEEQQKQIDAIKEASDKELEKMQQQLDVMEETLEYQKNNGLFWSEVTAMMQNWTPNQMADFVQKYTLSWKELSPADVAKNMRETLFEFEKWYEHLHSFGNFNDFYDTEMTKDTLRETYGVDVDDKNALNRARAIAKEAYQKYFVNEDFAKNYKSAEDAARQALLKNKDTLSKQKLDNTTTYNAIGADTSTGGGGGGTGPNAQDVLNQWNELMKKFNEAKEMYNNSNSKILSFSEWYKGPIPLDTLMHSPDLREGYDFYKKQYDDYVEAQRKKNIMDAFVDMRTTLNIMKQLLNYYGNSALKGKTLPSYDDGGMIEKTGLVLAHKHEGVLKPEQIDVLRKLTIASGKDSIVYQLAELRDSWEQISVPMANLAATQSNPLTIQNATVNVNVQSIANDYDARRAGQMALDEMVRIARQSSVQNLRR